jgi:fatty acid desaturase
MPRGHTEIPVGLNLLILVGQLLGISACFFAGAQNLSWPALALVAALFGILMNSVYAIIHEAEHAMLFPNRFWNDFTGAFLALFFPAPFHLIRQGHLGHHLRNRSDDEAFDLYFPEDNRVWRFMIFYGIITGFYWVVVALSNIVFLLVPFCAKTKYWEFDPPSRAFMESLNPAYRRLIQLECVAAIILHGLIIWLGGIPLLNYAVMYLGFGFMWSAMQYVHHYGAERHVTRGARNLWIWKPLDLFWLNHNWHLTHHENPTMPWIHLPQLGAKENSGFLLRAYLRMWQGPKEATERVQNKYAGRIIN